MNTSHWLLFFLRNKNKSMKCLLARWSHVSMLGPMWR